MKNFFLSLFLFGALAVSAQAQSVSQVYLATSKSNGSGWTDIMSTTISTAGTYVIAVSTTAQLAFNPSAYPAVNVQSRLLKNGTYISLSLAQQDCPVVSAWAPVYRLVSFAVVTVAANDVIKLQVQATEDVTGSANASITIDGQDAFDGSTVMTILQI